MKKAFIQSFVGAVLALLTRPRRFSTRTHNVVVGGDWCVLWGHRCHR